MQDQTGSAPTVRNTMTKTDAPPSILMDILDVLEKLVELAEKGRALIDENREHVIANRIAINMLADIVLKHHPLAEFDKGGTVQ